MEKSNGETKMLSKIVYVIAILSAIIAPWIYHDRAITRIETKLESIEKKIDRLDSVKVVNHGTNDKTHTIQ